MKDAIMVLRCFLTVNSNGSVRVTKGRPSVDYDEVAIGLQLELPRALFEKPQLSARLVIPEGAVLPAELPVEVVANVREALEQASGMQVRLTVGNPGEEG